jgi:hypothetical protein
VKLSILFPETRSVERAIAGIEQLERLGFHSAVMGHAMDFDPIAVFALAGARTERSCSPLRWSRSSRATRSRSR